MNRIYQQTFPGVKNAGFTLIELLVVVLIIGILSAAALPQYEKAVIKARIAGAVPMAKNVRDNVDMYYLEEGKWPVVGGFSDTESMLDYSNKSCDSRRRCCRVGDYVVWTSWGSVVVLYLPGGSGCPENHAGNNWYGAGWYAGAGSSSPGNMKMACVAGRDNSKALSICKGYGRHLVSYGSGEGYFEFYEM